MWNVQQLYTTLKSQNIPGKSLNTRYLDLIGFIHEDEDISVSPSYNIKVITDMIWVYHKVNTVGFILYLVQFR